MREGLKSLERRVLHHHGALSIDESDEGFWINVATLDSIRGEDIFGTIKQGRQRRQRTGEGVSEVRQEKEEGREVRYTLTIANWTPPTLNATLGRHWRTSHKAKVAAADILVAEAHNQGVPKATGKRRLSLRVSGWARGGRLPDADAFHKCFLDACVRAGLLIDDDARWLDGNLTVTIERGLKITVIELVDVK